MPKRQTILYTSSDGLKGAGDDELIVYYCKFSGRHAFTAGEHWLVVQQQPLSITAAAAPPPPAAPPPAAAVAHPPQPPPPQPPSDVDIDTLPRRRTDDSRILDTTKHTVRLYTTDGGVKLLRRKDGAVERQYRLNVGKLPVAYRSEVDGTTLFVMDGAVTAFQKDPGALLVLVGLWLGQCGGCWVDLLGLRACADSTVVRTEEQQQHTKARPRPSCSPHPRLPIPQHQPHNTNTITNPNPNTPS